MKKAKTRGFTLIEVLIVVLIIGVLGAVALPQYQLAVEKTRAAQLLPILNQVYLAQKRYYLEHGAYATAWDQLDVDFTSFGKYTPGDWVIYGPHNSQLRLYESAVWIHTNTKIGSYLGYYYSGPWSELKWCRADPANSLSVHVCKSLTGRSTHTSGSVESGVLQYTFPESPYE